MDSQEHFGLYSGIQENIDGDVRRKSETGSITTTSPWNFIRGFKYRKIMRRSDMLKILFVSVWVCQLCLAQPCGDNPMRLIDSYSRSRGVPSEQLLNAMQMSHRADYTLFMREYRRYLDCTQMVQNGYFKRSVDRHLYPRVPIVQATWSSNRRQLMDEIADEVLSQRTEVDHLNPIRTVPSLLKRIRKYISTYEDPSYETYGRDSAHAWPALSDVIDDIKR